MKKDTLQEIFDKFGQSKATFVKANKKVSMYHVDDKDILFQVKDEYDPTTAQINKEDPIESMMLGHYNELFVKHDNKFAKSSSMMEQTMKEIFMEIKSALINASPLKQPHQSKLYKWFEYGTINTPAMREGMIALYRYIYKHTDEDFRFKEGSENPHAKNVVAILEKMKEKYER